MQYIHICQFMIIIAMIVIVPYIRYAGGCIPLNTQNIRENFTSMSEI